MDFIIPYTVLQGYFTQFLIGIYFYMGHIGMKINKRQEAGHTSKYPTFNRYCTKRKKPYKLVAYSVAHFLSDGMNLSMEDYKRKISYPQY